MRARAAVVLAAGVLAGCAGATAPPPDAGQRAAAVAKPESTAGGRGASPNAPSGGVDPGFATDLAIRIFFDLCVANPADEAGRVAWLRRSNFAPMPPGPATPALPGNPGTTWMRMDPPSVAVPMAVVTSPTSGVGCAVLGPLAVPDRAAARFAAAMEALARPGLVVRKERDEAAGPGGGPGRRLIYRVGAAPVEAGGFLFALSARPPAPGGDGLALLVTASRAGPG